MQCPKHTSEGQGKSTALLSANVNVLSAFCCLTPPYPPAGNTLTQHWGGKRTSNIGAESGKWSGKFVAESGK
jgi:hypothetical protein